MTGYHFGVPSALIIGVFGIFPVFFTLSVSLFRRRLARGSFPGLDNYVRLFGSSPAAFAAGLLLLGASLAALAAALPSLASPGDKDVYDSLRVTIWYSACTVPVQLACALFLAVLLTRRMRGRRAFRVPYQVPCMAPTDATAAVFELLFSLRPDPFANQVLRLAGAGSLQWLQEPKGINTLLFGGGAQDAGLQKAGVIAFSWGEGAQGPSLALSSVVFFSSWVFIGYYAVIYISGLGSIPRQLFVIVLGFTAIHQRTTEKGVTYGD